MYRYEVAQGFRDDVAHFSALISPVVRYSRHSSVTLLRLSSCAIRAQ
jgi:hypothetical protein